MSSYSNHDPEAIDPKQLMAGIGPGDDWPGREQRLLEMEAAADYEAWLASIAAQPIDAAQEEATYQAFLARTGGA
jgi:hypothetical protein